MNALQQATAGVIKQARACLTPAIWHTPGLFGVLQRQEHSHALCHSATKHLLYESCLGENENTSAFLSRILTIQHVLYITKIHLLLPEGHTELKYPRTLDLWLIRPGL